MTCNILVIVQRSPNKQVNRCASLTHGSSRKIPSIRDRVRWLHITVC